MSKANQDKKYCFSKIMLEHDNNITEQNPKLSGEMLAHPCFISSLNKLLFQLKRDGHNIDGPMAEFRAMRKIIQKWNKWIAQQALESVRLRLGKTIDLGQKSEKK